jgi:hypothetical protein
LATQLKHVQPEVRDQFAEVAAKMSSSAQTAAKDSAPKAEVAARLSN